MGDVAKGAKIFKTKCAQCHTVAATDGHKQGEYNIYIDGQNEGDSEALHRFKVEKIYFNAFIFLTDVFLLYTTLI